ncbi:MAG: hypothetical protein ABW123_17050 [Cystobacter sp.]
MRVTRFIGSALWVMGLLAGCGGIETEERSDLGATPLEHSVSTQAPTRCEAGCIARADLCIKRQLKPIAECVADRSACLEECALTE